MISLKTQETSARTKAIAFDDPLRSAPAGRQRFPFALACLSAALMLIGASPVLAASTWNGVGGNVNWSTGANWGGTAPVGSTTTDLIFAGSTNTGTAGTPLNQNILAPFLLRSIAFSAGGGAFFLGGGALQFDGPGCTITQSSSSAENIANNIDVANKIGNDTTTITLTGSGTGIVTLSGNILPGVGQRDYAISKTGTATFVLSGTNSYGGATTVSGGTLLVNGSTAAASVVTVNGSGTTLGGTGTISGAVTLGNTTAGAILSPGAKGTPGTAAAVGTLNTGALTLTGANTFHIDASGTLVANWDKLGVTGTVVLGTTSTLELSIANGLTFTYGAQYTLLANDGTDAISGTFANAANGATITANGYSFSVNYAGGDGNDLVLTSVPEPGTWVAGTLALGALGFTQRRRFRRTLCFFLWR
jgi:autotransporter-associated beta strand protein